MIYEEVIQELDIINVENQFYFFHTHTCVDNMNIHTHCCNNMRNIVYWSLSLWEVNIVTYPGS